MLKKVLKAVIPLVSIAFALPAMADYPVAIADQFVVHGSQTTKLDLLKNDIGNNLKLANVNAWTENGNRVFVEDNTNRSSIFDLYQYGDVRYVPREGFSGKDGFWYVIEDDQGRKNAIRVIVDVRPASSELPAPQNDYVEVVKDTPIRINALKNDLFSDIGRPSDNTFTSRGVIADYNFQSANGGRVEKIEVDSEDRLFFSLGINGSRYTENTFKYQFRYTPPAGFVGVDTFTYAVRDTRNRTNNPEEIGDAVNDRVRWTQVTLNVTENDIRGPYPVANPDVFDITYFQRCIVCKGQDIGDVLKNDTGTNLLLKLNSAWSQNGARVRITANHMGHPVITYNAFFAGSDRIWYVIEDEFGRKNYSYVDLNITSGDP